MNNLIVANVCWSSFAEHTGLLPANFMVSADARREPPATTTKMVVVRRLPILKRNLYKQHID